MITIRASTWNIITQMVSPLLLVFVGVSLKLGRPGWLFPLLWMAAGLILGVAGFFWLPVTVRADTDGLTRVFILRRERIPWDEVRAVRRAKTGLSFRSLRHRTPAKQLSPIDQGRRWDSAGLSIVTASGREKVISESLETQEEYEGIRDLVHKHAPEVTWSASAPMAFLTRDS